MKLIEQLETRASKYNIDVEYDGNEVILVCPDGYEFESGTPTEIYSPWDRQPAVAMLRQALADIDNLGRGMIRGQ